jgi:hypothetical protein
MIKVAQNMKQVLKDKWGRFGLMDFHVRRLFNSRKYAINSHWAVCNTSVGLRMLKVTSLSFVLLFCDEETALKF